MKKYEIIWIYILSIPKTLFFNFKYFSFFQAIRLPVLISYKVILKAAEGEIQIIPTGGGRIKIGFGYVGIFDYKRSRTIWECKGKVIFRGKIDIGHGSKICVGPEGILEFGDNFTITAESTIICFKKIKFSDDVLISWQCLIMDTDFHKLLENGEITNEDKEICIGRSVWIGCRCTILKGVSIADGCVIAANTNVVKSVENENVLIAGNPNRIIKTGIYWMK